MSDLVVREPTSLVAVEDQCASIEVWAERCDSVPELRDAGNKLAAIDEYLSRTSSEGRARVAAAMRRLEVRIGQLFGPEKGQGSRTDLTSHRDEKFHPQQEADFRQMAAHPEVVEDVIAESTDDQPASRRQVLRSIREAGPTSAEREPQRSPLPDEFMRAVVDLGRATDHLTRLTGDNRFARNSGQIAQMYLHDLTRANDSLQRVIDQLS